MGKVKRLELWWQMYLYVTSRSGLRKKPAITLCAFGCTIFQEISNKFRKISSLNIIHDDDFPVPRDSLLICQKVAHSVGNLAIYTLLYSLQWKSRIKLQNYSSAIKRSKTLSSLLLRRTAKWKHAVNKNNNNLRISGFGGLEDACWPLVPKFAGSNPAEALGFFRAKKSPARLPSEGK
jgi:hypothetical protein